MLITPRRFWVVLGAISVLAVGRHEARSAPLAWDRAHGVLARDRMDPPVSSVAQASQVLAQLDQQIIALDSRSGTLATDVETRERRCQVRARVYTKLIRVGLLSVTGGFDDMVHHAMHVEALHHALASDLDQIKALRTEQIEIARSRTVLNTERSEVATQRESLLQAQSWADQAQQRRAAFDRAFASSADSDASRRESITVYGAGVTAHEPSPADETNGFATMRGRLPFPLPGRAQIRSVTHADANGPGLEFTAPAGTPVRAVYEGRVAFSATYAEYGRMVILDHGDHYYTLSANLADVDVRVGDEVSTGARIGSVGDQGQGSMLYFEIRHRTETLDPKPWLGLAP